MNKIGHETFLRDLKAFQLIDTTEQVSYTRTLVKPISRLKQRLLKLLTVYPILIGTVFGFFTLKVLIENLMRLVK